MTETQRPRVTLVLIAYNQERYIREAVASALAQTYEPLEIIISDDCSSDGTFEIMGGMTSQYRGPHKLILNRTPNNLGISAHVRALHEMSTGMLVVHAAGDDVSYPDRITKIVAAYMGASIKPSLIETNAEMVDEVGGHIRLYHEETNAVRRRPADPWCNSTFGGGSTYAIHRDLIDLFESPRPGILAEDLLLRIRANMLQGVLYIPDVLIKYRVTYGGAWNKYANPELSSKKVIENESAWTKHNLLIAEQAMADASALTNVGVLTIYEFEQIKKCYSKEMFKLCRWRDVVDGSLISSTTSLMSAIFTDQNIAPRRWLKFYLIRWLPWSRSFRRKTPP